MKNLKKFLVIAFIAMQILVIIYLWSKLIYSIFASIPIGDLLDWQWWIFFFALDLWTAKFFAEKNKQLKAAIKSETN